MKRVILVTHFILIIGYWVSPFFIDWKTITAFSLLIYIPTSFYLGYCPLTRYQFGNNEKGFQQHYLSIVGINLNRKQNMLFARLITPLAISAIAVVYQIGLK